MNTFITRHISDESRERLFSRMVDPDDTLTEEGGSLDDLIGELTKIAGDRMIKDAKALAEAQNGNAG